MKLRSNLIDLWERWFGPRHSESLDALWRVARDYGEGYAGEWLLKQHWPTIDETLKLEFPQLQGETIPTALVPMIVKRAIGRLVEHMV